MCSSPRHPAMLQKQPPAAASTAISKIKHKTCQSHILYYLHHKFLLHCSYEKAQLSITFQSPSALTTSDPTKITITLLLCTGFTMKTSQRQLRADYRRLSDVQLTASVLPLADRPVRTWRQHEFSPLESNCSGEWLLQSFYTDSGY